jgi:hypothetical protein
MDEKHKKKATVEIHQFYVLRQQKDAPRVVCTQCPLPIASLVAPDEAAIVTGVSTRAIYRWVEDGIIHFQETANNSVLVCLNSFPPADHPGSLKEQ